ncbi:MAG TPA: Rid family hydrolase [Solirubrobacteraceae bacterium]|nr:Rid family hydrolase [Solirubrobacteraceae bacterium]
MKPLHTNDAPAPSGGYSQGILSGGFAFISGQGPFAPDGSLVAGSIERQVRQVFANLEAIAQAAGGSLGQAVRVGVYLSDLDQFDEMDRVYREIFAEPRPARTTIQTALVGFDVEADVVIAVGQ